MIAFRLKLPLTILSLPGLLLGTASMNLLAGPAMAENAASIEEFVITGVRVNDRTVLDSPVPIDVLSETDLRQSGFIGNEVGQAISVLAPSFNFPRQSNSGTSDHIRAGQLRGMSPDQMLVLVNGKRRHISAVVNTETKIGRGTAAVDFNTIPLGAISRIEILRDGAGAQYGSDAIAGVVNVIMNEDPSGASFNATYGFHHTHLDPIDRTLTDGETIALDGDVGFSLGPEGFLRVGAEYVNRNATNRAGFDQIPFFIAPTEDNLALQGERNYAMGDPASEDVKLWYNSALPMGKFTFYSFGTYAERNTDGATFFRYPDESRNVKAIYPGGFLPVTTGENDDLAITGGAKGNLGGWDIDNSVTYGRNEFTYGVENSLNASLGPDSPTEFESGTYRFTQLTVNVDASRTLAPAFLDNPVMLAIGVEYRREDFETIAGEPASFAAGPFDGDIGAQGAPGLTPADEVDRNREVYGAYIDLSSDVTDRLFVNMAGRYEYYDGFGSSGTGKASASYHLMPGLSLRGAVSNNLRAPALSQIFFSDRTINFGENRSLVTTRTLPVDDPIAKALGAEDLKPERSFNLSAGITGQVGDRLSFTLDAYRIRVDNRITLSDRLFGGPLADFVQSLPGGQGIQSVRFFTNAIDTRTYGVDFVANFEERALGGQYNLTLAYSYAKTDIVSFTETPDQLLALDPSLRLIGVEEINTIEEASPRSKLIVTNTWENGDWRLLGRVSYYGSTVRVFNFGGGFEPRQKYGAEISVDAEVEFKLNQSASLAIGGQNLLDNYPDLSSPDINFFGNLPYDILSPIGVNGRYLYTRLAIRY